MSERSASSRESLSSRKTREFRIEHRKQALQGHFSTARKQMLRREAEESHRASAKLSQQDIDALVDKLYPNSPEYSQAVNSLWTDCLHSERIQFFSRESIGLICVQARRVKEEVLREADEGKTKTLDMLLWIVTNWAFHCCSLPPEVAQLVPDLLQLLSADLHPRLNIIIIYLFTNCCCTESVRLALLQGEPIRAATRCSLFDNKETDLSTFLSTFLHNLPYDYRLKEAQSDCAIDFVRKYQELSRVDKDLRVDCMLITSKLMIVNEGAFHAEVISRLSPNIKGFLLKLDNIVREENTEDLLDLLIHTYRRPQPTLHPKSELFQEEMYAVLWRAVSNELEKGGEEQGTQLEAIRTKIWQFLEEFCQIESPATTQILEHFYQQCSRQLMEDQEHAAVKLLVKHHRDYLKEENFTFWANEFVQLHPDTHLCKNLLKVIRKCLDAVLNPRHLLDQQSSESFMDVLVQLQMVQVEENMEVRELVKRVYYYDGREEMEEEKQQSRSNKSFRTASQVFLTPLFIHSNPIVKPLTPNKHDSHK